MQFFRVKDNVKNPCIAQHTNNFLTYAVVYCFSILLFSPLLQFRGARYKEGKWLHDIIEMNGEE